MKFKPATEKTLIDCLLIILAIFIPYHQVAQHTFVNFDDDSYIFLNEHINRGFTWDSLIWAFTDTHSANWLRQWPR